MKLGSGSIVQLLAFLLLNPAAPGIPSVPQKCSGEKIVAVAVVNQRRWVQERLTVVNLMTLVTLLAVKLYGTVLHNNIKCKIAMPLVCGVSNFNT